MWTCSSAQPVFNLFRLHGSSLRVWLIQLLFRCLRSSSALGEPVRVLVASGLLFNLSRSLFSCWSISSAECTTRRSRSEARSVREGVPRDSPAWLLFFMVLSSFNLQRIAPSGSCLHSGSDATGAGSGCSSRFARCQLCLLCFLFKSIKFLFRFLGELLQGEADIDLESPDQKTRCFMVQIALPW
jgi:hypothetical protein